MSLNFTTLGIVVLMVLYWIGSQPVPQVEAQMSLEAVSSENRNSLANFASDDIRQQFAYDLATRLNNPNPSPEIIAFIVQWTIAEDDSNGAFARNNPLNTTQEGFNTTHSINDDGVKGYASYEDGMNATVQTLSYGYYTEIVAGIQTNDYNRALQGLFSSPWASSHYGFGASWPK